MQTKLIIQSPKSVRRALVSVLALMLLVPAAASADNGQRTVVLFIGGLDSTPAGNDLNFGMLADELRANWGYQTDDVRQWFYGGVGPYAAGATCQSIAVSESQLIATLRAMRATHAADHVVLVGHSLGGVIAFQSLAYAEDLVSPGNPFVSRIVAIDSPLGGLSWDEMLFATLSAGECQALAELRMWHGVPGRQQWLADLANWEVARGVAVEVVSNPQDLALYLNEQQINALVNVVVDVADRGLNHAAVLKTAYGVSRLAALIGSQGY